MGNTTSNTLTDQNQGDVSNRISPGLRDKFSRGVSYNMKIVVRGDNNVGKSTLLRRLQGKDFNHKYIPTPQIEATTIGWNYNKTEELVKVEVWDVVDHARVRAYHHPNSLKLHNDVENSNPKQSSEDISHSSNATADRGRGFSHTFCDAQFVNVYKDTHAVIFMLDITKPWTFLYVQRNAAQVPVHIPVLLLANKVDLKQDRQVTVEELTAWTENMAHDTERDVRFVEVSLKDGFGLKYLHSYLSLPFLRLQRKTLTEQMETNTNNLKDVRNKLDRMRLQSHTDYILTKAGKNMSTTDSPIIAPLAHAEANGHTTQAEATGNTTQTEANGTTQPNIGTPTRKSTMASEPQTRIHTKPHIQPSYSRRSVNEYHKDENDGDKVYDILDNIVPIVVEESGTAPTAQVVDFYSCLGDGRGLDEGKAAGEAEGEGGRANNDERASMGVSVGSNEELEVGCGGVHVAVDEDFVSNGLKSTLFMGAGASESESESESGIESVVSVGKNVVKNAHERPKADEKASALAQKGTHKEDTQDDSTDRYNRAMSHISHNKVTQSKNYNAKYTNAFVSPSSGKEISSQHETVLSPQEHGQGFTSVGNDSLPLNNFYETSEFVPPTKSELSTYVEKENVCVDLDAALHVNFDGLSAGRYSDLYEGGDGSYCRSMYEDFDSLSKHTTSSSTPTHSNSNKKGKSTYSEKRQDEEGRYVRREKRRDGKNNERHRHRGREEQKDRDETHLHEQGDRFSGNRVKRNSTRGEKSGEIASVDENKRKSHRRIKGGSSRHSSSRDKANGVELEKVRHE